MILSNLSVRAKFGTLICACVLGFGAFGAISYRTITQTAVNGPVYAEIVTGKDLVADILPPPEYILEAYLTTTQMVLETNATEVAALESKLIQLRKDFEDRQTYWKTHLPPGPMSELLLVKSSEPARQFFSLADQRLLPALHAGKREDAAAVMNGDMRRAYEAHRAAIDQLVVLATEYSSKSEGHAASTLKAGWRMLVGTAAGCLILLVTLSLLIARSVTKPLGIMLARLKDIAQGEGDLTKRVDVSSKDEIGLVGQWFNQFVGKIEGVIAQVKAGAMQIDSGSEQIASASQSLAQGASEQASSLQQISASIEEMSGQTKQSAENARQAATLAEESKKAADRGQQEMALMSSAVGQIKQSSSEISKIIKVIDEIAFQTNLLALNAAVEAARAGEAGKGFAVVAEEVRNLAQRSAEAAKSTSAMIEESVQRSENGVSIAGRVGKALEEITGATNKVNALLAEIASSSGEQAAGIGQVNQGVGQLDQVTQQNAGNSEELASSAEELSSQVASLNDLVAQFKVGQEHQTTAA